MKINEYIEPLLTDENALSLDDLKQMLYDGKFTREELDYVLSEELVKCVDNFLSGELVAEVLPEGNSELSGEKGRTEVYFWGMKGSGKTSVIGSILAAQPHVVEKVNTGSSLDRARSLIRAYHSAPEASVPTSVLPKSAPNAGDLPSVVNIDIKDSHSHLHPLSLIEMHSASVDQPVLHQTKNDKIHILCYDCRKAGVAQDNFFINILSELKRNGLLMQSVGVYCLVTKVDSLVNVPKEYRSEVAQTMITADHLDLWMAVKNACYEMQIYDATPIPYYIGSVRLQSIATVNLECARKFIEKPLALKSHPYRSAVGKVLRFGSWWSTSLLIIAACVALVFGVCLTMSALDPMPSEKIEPFNYASYFEQKEASQVKGGTYFRNRDKYRALQADLQTERFITCTDGKRVLSAREYIECDKLLSNDFAEILYGGMQYEFKQSEWGEGVLDRLKEECTELFRNQHISDSKRDALKEAVAIINKYYNAKEVVKLSKNCKTLEDVETVKQNIDEYNEEPFTNNTKLQSDLQGAIENAYMSCARATCDEARQTYLDFLHEWQQIDANHSINIIAEIQEQKALRKRTVEECSSILSRISTLRDRLHDNDTALETLSTANEWIEKIRNKRTLFEI